MVSCTNFANISKTNVENKKEVLHLSYNFFDPNEPSLKLTFPYKTYFISSGKKSEDVYSCDFYVLRTKTPAAYYIDINKCYFNEDFKEYNLKELELGKINNRYFSKVDKEKSIQISPFSTNKGFGLKSKITYFVDDKSLIKIIIKREYLNLDKKLIDEMDWLKKNQIVFESFKTFSLYVYKDMVVGANDNSSATSK
jgi:hypothetical protein